jgi:hypothetical protein
VVEISSVGSEIRSLFTVPAGYLTLPSRLGWCAAVWLRLRLVRFVKARARAIVEDAMVRTCQSKLEKMEKCRLPRMSLRSWDPAMLRSPGFARGESLGCYLGVTRGRSDDDSLCLTEGEPE